MYKNKKKIIYIFMRESLYFIFFIVCEQMLIQFRRKKMIAYVQSMGKCLKKNGLLEGYFEYTWLIFFRFFFSSFSHLICLLRKLYLETIAKLYFRYRNCLFFQQFYRDSINTYYVKLLMFPETETDYLWFIIYGLSSLWEIVLQFFFPCCFLCED